MLYTLKKDSKNKHCLSTIKSVEWNFEAILDKDNIEAKAKEKLGFVHSKGFNSFGKWKIYVQGSNELIKTIKY